MDVIPKLSYALATTMLSLSFGLLLIMVSPAWPTTVARFGQNSALAASVVFLTLVASAFFGANTLLLSILVRESLRNREPHPNLWRTYLGLGVLATMITLMAVGAISAIQVLITLLTSPTAPLAPWPMA